MGLPRLNQYKAVLMCLAQGHDTVMLELATPRFQVKHSTTELLRSCTGFGVSGPLSFVFVCLLFYIPVNSYGHVETMIASKG